MSPNGELLKPLTDPGIDSINPGCLFLGDQSSISGKMPVSQVAGKSGVAHPPDFLHHNFVV